MSRETDNNYRSYAGESKVLLSPAYAGFPSPAEAAKYDDILKFSDCVCVDYNGAYETINGGKEDCIDINNGCTGCNVFDLKLAPTHTGITVKGGSSLIEFTDIEFLNPAKWADVELGQHTWVNNKRTTNVRLQNCRRSDGKPLRIICWNADNPILIGTSAKVYCVPKFIWQPYFWYMNLRTKK